MNNDIFKKIGASKENFRMTESESQNIKAALMAHMKANPVKQKNNFFASLMRPMRMAVSAFSVVLVATVGVTYASEASLPGDFLYPVKVNVMEEVVSTFKINKESKAEYEVERAEKRIEEAIELAEMGELSPEVEIKVLESIEEQAQKVEELVVQLEEKEELEKSQKIQHEWNKLLVENQPIVLQLVQEEPEPLDATAPVIEALPEVEVLPTVTEPVITIDPVIVEPVAEEPIIEVIEVLPAVTEPVVTIDPVIVEPVAEEPIIEVIEVLPTVTEPVITIDPVIVEPVAEEPIIEVIEVLPAVTEPVITIDPIIIEPVVEEPIIEVIEVTPSSVLIDSGLLFDLKPSGQQLDLNGEL